MTCRSNQRDWYNTPTRCCIGIAHLVVLIAASPLPLFSQEPLRGWSTDPRTSAIELVAVQESEKLTTFVLKNVSTKPITAFAVSYGNTTRGVDRFLTDASLQPGESDSVQVGTEELSPSKHILELSAAVFEDGTSDGLDREIQNITVHRLGRTLETERVKAILDGAPGLGRDFEDLARLAKQVGSEPATVAEAIASLQDVRLPGVDVRTLDLGGQKASRFLAAVRGTRHFAIQEINQLERLPLSDSRMSQSPRDIYLSELRRIYGSLSAKSQRFLQTVRGGALR